MTKKLINGSIKLPRRKYSPTRIREIYCSILKLKKNISDLSFIYHQNVKLLKILEDYSKLLENYDFLIEDYENDE